MFGLPLTIGVRRAPPGADGSWRLVVKRGGSQPAAAGKAVAREAMWKR